MVEIFDGERWDISSGSNKRHTGTLAYLAKIGAKTIEGTRRSVQQSYVDGEGKFQRDQDAHRT